MIQQKSFNLNHLPTLTVKHTPGLFDVYFLTYKDKYSDPWTLEVSFQPVSDSEEEIKVFLFEGHGDQYEVVSDGEYETRLSEETNFITYKQAKVLTECDIQKRVEALKETFRLMQKLVIIS